MVNLHIHTNYSDGIYPVDEILNRIDKLGINFFSITDHDSVKAYDEISDDERLIRGVEISCKYDNGICHILGYGIDIGIIDLFCDRIVKSRVRKGKKMLKMVQNLGYEINNQDLDLTTNIIGKRDIIKALLNKKYFNNYDDANKIFKNFNLNTIKPSIKECIDIIKLAGGISVIAHPWTLNLTIEELRKFVVENRIDGIEVFNHNINKKLYNELDFLANELNIYKTCGTDFHGYDGYNNLIISENVDCSKILKKLGVNKWKI